MAGLAFLVAQFGPSSTNSTRDRKTNSTTDPEASTPPPAPSVTDPGNQQATPSAATTITITADGFSPASITIAKGTTLTWRNGDTNPHAIDPASGSSGPHSPQLMPGESFNYSFQQPGTYTYIDALYPDHRGTVTVTAGD